MTHESAQLFLFRAKRRRAWLGVWFLVGIALCAIGFFWNVLLLFGEGLVSAALIHCAYMWWMTWRAVNVLERADL